MALCLLQDWPWNNFDHLHVELPVKRQGDTDTHTITQFLWRILVDGAF